MTTHTAVPKLEEIASSSDSIYDAMMDHLLDAASDVVERVADAGLDQMEREVEFAGQVWTVEVHLKSGAAA